MENDWFYEYFINEVKAIRKKCISTGSTTQSDWNQNDSKAADYVKNRPFYTADPVETVLVEEATLTFVDGGDTHMAAFDSTVEVTAGETYKVSWDGNAYECTCETVEDTYAIGNLSIVGLGSDTGEPFIMAVSNGRGIQILTADASASHTISLSVPVAQVVKIDKKYLFQPDWNQNDDTAPDYVKNRPFYIGYTEEKALVEESAVTFEANRDIYMGRSQSTFSAIIGETYKISWDGTVYESACLNFQETISVGNLSIMGVGSDTGEPFLIVIDDPIEIYTLDTAASHTISISGRTTQVVKIDEKYLPDTVATKSDVEVAQSTANNAQSTANNAQSTANNAQTRVNNAVSYAFSQKLTDEQKQLARTNIGAGTSSFSGNYNDLTNKPLSLNGLIQSNTGTTQIDVLDYTTNGDTTICQTQYVFDTSSSIFKRLLSTRIIGYRDNGYTVVYDKNLRPDWKFFDNVQINDVVYYGVGIGENITTLKDKYLFISNGGFIIIKDSAITMENPIRYFKIEYGGAAQSIPIAYLSETFISPAIQRVGDDLILSSSTSGSTKKFKITVDDTGTLTATEVT